jgi:HAD superfamily hydrolase (TIGR01490 family)
MAVGKPITDLQPIVPQMPGPPNCRRFRLCLILCTTPKLPYVPTLNLAIFDLDNTLLSGDSDYLWGQFLVERGLVDGPRYALENQRYYEAYKAGTLDIREFLRFSLAPLRNHDLETLRQWHRQYLVDKILPIIPEGARELLRLHRECGHELLIITATNRFVTEPIAAELEVDALLATEPEIRDGRYTGEVTGTPCFQAGKVERLAQWLSQRSHRYARRWFYSDSHNDLPLLEQVDHPVAVDPDAQLEAVARNRGWPIASLRRETGAAIFSRTVD